ncbi:MAG: AAA family ATPase [Lachnospiraceae bacterium]|nr:AAA family ATPase [Lachnospiraceae bacterium]
MKLLDLHINGFGKFHDRSISFADGLNIVYGKNEAGKSTLHSFIRSMLFGMERQRGRAARTDQFSKYRPWDLKNGYEGRLRLESGGHIYRIERNFANSREFTVVDETAGREVEPTKALMDQLLCGLSETAYNNTISIGQLKSATDGGMVSELKNYIANMNTAGNMALNITKASAFLKAQKKELSRQMVPEAARSYTTLLGDIRNMEREISAPEYENHLTEYQARKAAARKELEQLQTEKEGLLQKIARGRQVLESSKFTDEASIQAYEEHGRNIYEVYTSSKSLCEKKSRTVWAVVSLVLGVLALAGAGFLLFRPWDGLAQALSGMTDGSAASGLVGGGAASGLSGLSGGGLASGLSGGSAGGGLLLYLPSLLLLMLSVLLAAAGILRLVKNAGIRKDMEYNQKLLAEIFSRHLGDASVTAQAMEAFLGRMAEFRRLSQAIRASEHTVDGLTRQMEGLKAQQAGVTEEIEKQQKLQWELEKKLEHLANCKTQAEGLKDVLAENDRIAQELAAIDLAQETMTELSSSIRDSFGLYLNKEASQLIDGITGGIYNSMSIDENLNIFMNTKTKLVPIDQVSSGTMDQIYLALRLAAARLIQNGAERMPLIFDDSFVLYDDERLKTALKWLVEAFDGQIIVFTCHRREAQMLTANQVAYHLIEI